jgi:hypothetical protein
MAHLLLAREIIIKTYKHLEVFIQPVIKFILGLFIFTSIMSLDHVHPALADYTEQMTSTLVVWLFALLFTVMSTSLSWLLIIATVVVQLSATVELAAVVFLFLFFLFLFYARMAPKESILIVFVLLAFRFELPYLVPLLVGLYFPVTAIIPVTIGVFINAQLPVVFRLMAPQATLADLELADLPTVLPDIFSEVWATLLSSLGSAQEWLTGAVVFALVIILVHVASRQAIDYAKEIAIALGCIMTIFGFIVAVLVGNDATTSIGNTVILTIICGIIALIIRFFDSVLDYQRAESVQFEDDNNYYHVRIVPKVVMTRPKRTVKVIRPDRTGEEGTPPPRRRPRPRPSTDTGVDSGTRALPPLDGSTRALPPLDGSTRALPPLDGSTRALPPLDGSTRALPPLDGTRRFTPPDTDNDDAPDLSETRPIDDILLRRPSRRPPRTDEE